MTYGPTWIPLDPVRVISNISTGKLGFTLACLLKKEKAKVTVLQGPIPLGLKRQGVRVLPFRFYNELLALINVELKKHYDIIIHAAAVSDYKLPSPWKKKISSSRPRLKLELKPTMKIIEKIKRISPNSFLVGFKLTDQINKQTLRYDLRDLFDKARCDLVVANSFVENKYLGGIVDFNRNILAKATTRKELSQKLICLLRERL